MGAYLVGNETNVHGRRLENVLLELLAAELTFVCGPANSVEDEDQARFQ